VSERVGVGVVGYGTSGSSLHAPLIGAEPRLELRAVVSSDADRVHRDLPGVPVVPAPSALLDDPAIELVVVAAANTAHHELARAALVAGRHVVVDKPFTVTTAEADDLIRVAAEQDRRVSAFQQRRWDADFRTVRRCVEEGLLGWVGTYVARYDRFRPEPTARWTEAERPGSGVLYDLGSHLIDQALCLFGTPETVWADLQAQRPGAATVDYAHVVLGRGRLRMILHAGSLVRASGPRFEVHGDGGSFVKDGIDGQIAALLRGGRPGDPGWGGATGPLRHADDRARRPRGDRQAGEPAGGLRGLLSGDGGGGARGGPGAGAARAGPRRHPSDRVCDAQQPRGRGGALGRRRRIAVSGGDQACPSVTGVSRSTGSSRSVLAV
jgi:scyllo-inositol 2-dehydrogenase (NADP+)